MITQTYNLSMIPGGVPVRVPVSQYDALSRELIFHLYSGDGQAFSVPSDATVTVEGTKSDKKGFSYIAAADGNAVTVTVTQQMTAAKGSAMCELRVARGDAVLGSANFVLAVEMAPLGDDTDMSESEIAVLETLKNQALEAAGNAASGASDAASSASSAEANAEAASDSAAVAALSQNAALSAQTAAETAKAQAEAAQSAAEAAQSTAETAQASAQTSQQSAALSASDAADSAAAAALSASGASASEENAASCASDAALSAQEAAESAEQVAVLLYDNAGAHNAIYRGKYLGAAVTTEQWAAISAGTFEDLYIGDYWTISGVNWRIAAFDYYYLTGDTSCTTHHAVIVPDTNLYTHAMNSANTTAGAYVGSEMYTEGLDQAKTTINTAFGSDHILSHRQYLQNAVTNGYPSGSSWYDSTVELMTEQNIYGGKAFAPTADGSTIPHIYTVDKSQYPLFALNPYMQTNRQTYWLRDVVSSIYFALAYSQGYTNCFSPSSAFGVRPAFSVVG